MTRRILDPRTADELGALDADAVARVREEAWPRPESAEEVHEALRWMGYVTAAEAEPWRAWLDALAAAGRVVRDGDRFFAVEAHARAEGRAARPARGARARSSSRPARTTRRSCCELEAEGAVLRARIDGPPGLVRPPAARAHPPLHPRPPAPRDRARDGGPVPALPGLLAARRSRPPRSTVRRGVAEVVEQLAGFEVAGGGVGRQRPARARPRLPARVARPAHAERRGRLGPPLGRGAVAGAPHADRARAARRPRRVDGARRGDRAARRRGPTAEEVLARAARRAARSSSRSWRAPAACRWPASRRASARSSPRAASPATPSAACAGCCCRLGAASSAGSSSGRWSLLGATRAAAGGRAAASAGRVRGAPAAAAHGRRVPPHDARASASPCPGATWRAPAACSRRAARSAAGASWPASTASSTRCPRPSRCCAACGASRTRPLGGDNFALPASDPLNFKGILTPQAAPAAVVHAPATLPPQSTEADAGAV